MRSISTQKCTGHPLTFSLSPVQIYCVAISILLLATSVPRMNGFNKSYLQSANAALCNLQTHNILSYEKWPDAAYAWIAAGFFLNFWACFRRLKKTRQEMYAQRNTEARSCNRCCSGKTVSIILIVVFPCMLTIIQLLFQLNANVFYY
jgi:hypothetical protein